jgi:hypothetical protein
MSDTVKELAPASSAEPAGPAKLKTNLHRIFATDEHLEEGGAWVDVNELYGLKIKVRRLRSEASIKAYEDIVRESFGEAKIRRPEDLNAKQSGDILTRQLARAVLIDWKGVYDENGDEIPYSEEAALAALNEMKDFREFVYQAANERDTFREKADKDAAKNS